jgi:hypothetical protein
MVHHLNLNLDDFYLQGIEDNPFFKDYISFIGFHHTFLWKHWLKLVCICYILISVFQPFSCESEPLSEPIAIRILGNT